ncbi:2,3,4,5-tetrahydropyridine-2,6-dicarboxylate N-succinyltransferase [Natronospirillum operosum]|uniref:2,3,4,5-tetrahydropyridine-2,6-dicarboxylate N-succinyltransferase n=1 Tax=Natronospirillum operosum TaxID=2759953 RepID=A0A4Z0WH70_9GAMM|nr:2,3,4,5-tetrahydropyridine-2,6-dicarboxylate N-succinyltransferase [Natronospirillum operosum]TGG95116.1 2,3,4,5-tetrahydropyridine-2,6-dicarboxylate N-succinyltransferase [Natronospirillum operosum]
MTFAIGLGSVTRNSDKKIIEAWFPEPLLSAPKSLQERLQEMGYQGGNEVLELRSSALHTITQTMSAAGHEVTAQFAARGVAFDADLVLVVLATDVAPQSVAEAFLKLHLISHRLVRPHGTDLSGMFGLLHNIAWTNQGPIDLPDLPERRMAARLAGETLSVDCVDKFPKMADYVVPSGVRIADTARVRLGAHVGAGTTVMHEGFINFNAGTLGKGMIEGRISAGVVVGDGSDLGGGCSTMGTLSGGGDIIISVGENCLLGANAGVGIPLGDRCTVESGLYITAGTKVQMLDENRQPVETVKARDLAGKSDLLFRRNSTNGQVECLTNKSAVALNDELHANN